MERILISQNVLFFSKCDTPSPMSSTKCKLLKLGALLLVVKAQVSFKVWIDRMTVSVDI